MANVLSPSGTTFTDRLRQAVEGLTPGYFALVMASGIISVGLELEGFDLLSNALLVVCGAAFFGLLGLNVWRFVGYRAATAEDFMDPRRAFGFFTFVAGTNVFGVRLGMAGHPHLTAALLVLSGAAWVVLGYVVPWTAVLGRQERPALAITVLAGARIVEMADAPMVIATRGLIAGVAVVFWAFATWLVPVLVAAGWWRHVVRKVPLRYDATLWSIIFPLGMYAVAGIYLGRADRLPVVETVGRAELWVAMAAWVVTLAAMLAHVLRTVFLRRVD